MPITTRTTITVCLALTGAVLAAPLTGCRGDRSEKTPRRFFPDMDQNPRWNPQDQSDFYVDGRTQRVPDPRAVAYGDVPWADDAFQETGWSSSFTADRRSLLAEDDAFHRGIDPMTGQPVRFAPVEITQQLIDRGEERFNIYCAICHGYGGDGKGSAGLRWSYAPANLTTGVYVDRDDPKGADGHLFDVVRNGVWSPTGANLMPGYAHAVDENDAWAIVAYMRVLQRANNATLDDVPPADRERLRTLRGPAPTPADTTEGDG